MTKLEFISEFESKNIENLSLVEEDSETIHVYYDTCPIWQYKFIEGKLAKKGQLFWELRWFYSERDIKN